MITKKFVVIVAVAMGMVLVTVSVQADVIFNNFGPGDDYHPQWYTSVAYDPDWDFMGQEYDLDTAMAFTPVGNSYFLDTIELALSERGGDNEIDVWLMDDNGGKPGTIIEAIHLSGAVHPYPGVYPPVVATSPSNPPLAEGVQYWVAVSTPGPSRTDIDWHYNTVGYAGLGAQRQLWDGVGDWNVFPTGGTSTFRVTGFRLGPIIYVDDDGPADFSSIQDAINYASSGFTIMVKAGQYIENLNLKTGVEVLGEGMEVTYIIGTGPKVRDVVLADNINNAQLDGFTISDAGKGMAGIKIVSSSVVISNNKITGNTDGIRIQSNSTGVIRNNIIHYNGDPDNAVMDMAICCLRSTPLVTNNLIAHNDEAGIYVGWAESSGAKVINNTIVGNPYYGIWCCDEAAAMIKNNIIVGNGAGIAASYNAVPDISYNDVWDNWWGNYYPQSGGVAAPGPGDISEDPVFDANYTDYYLHEDSPCIDAGDPNPVYNDIDGSRNDMGWHGGQDGSTRQRYGPVTTGFVFTTIGKIPVSEITKSGPSTGLANVSPDVASDYHIYQYTDAPFGGYLWISGLFGPSDTDVAYYQIWAAKWTGKLPPKPDEYKLLKEPLVKTVYTINPDGTVTATRVTCGPLNLGGKDGLYLRTHIGYWAHRDLKMIWNTRRWENGKYTLTYKAYNASFGEESLFGNDQDHITIIIDNTPVEAEIHSVKYDSGQVIPECGIINLASDTENLIFTITASHPSGYLKDYALHALYGKNKNLGQVVKDHYTGLNEGGPPFWHGVTEEPFDSNDAQPVQLKPWETCAYQFHLVVRARTTDGYHHINRRVFNDHYYLDLGSAYCGGADIDRSGKVDFGDLARLANRWLDTCGP